jgi:hypothetical protein
VGNLMAPFNQGRTATHELGHWLNLIHTWGDAACGDDHVEDTPWQEAANRGCPTAVVKTCGPGPYGDMYMNYMDFTNDACMNLFTNGQKARMWSLFAPGGIRYPLLSTTVLSAIPLADTLAGNSRDQGSSDLVIIYPNPASTFIWVKVSGDLKGGISLEIYNAMGQHVLTSQIYQSPEVISLQSLPSGMYYIKTGNGTSGQITKLVKM